MVTIPVLTVMINIMQPPHVLETNFSRILYKVITPYNPISWQHTPIECNLVSRYPNLVCDIKYGSPISNLPCLYETFIPKNLVLALNNPGFILSSLIEETTLGQMDKPFSIAEVHAIFRGHFYTSPLRVIEEPGSLTHLFFLIHHLSKADSNGCLTNGWLDASKFPTHYFSAACCADFVSLYSFSSLAILLLQFLSFSPLFLLSSSACSCILSAKSLSVYASPCSPSVCFTKFVVHFFVALF